MLRVFQLMEKLLNINTFLSVVPSSDARHVATINSGTGITAKLYDDHTWQSNSQDVELWLNTVFPPIWTSGQIVPPLVDQGDNAARAFGWKLTWEPWYRAHMDRLVFERF